MVVIFYSDAGGSEKCLDKISSPSTVRHSKTKGRKKSRFSRMIESVEKREEMIGEGR